MGENRQIRDEEMALTRQGSGLGRTVGWFAAFFAAVVAIGCGGGGGSLAGSTGGGLAGTPPAGQYLEFRLSGTQLDPLNLPLGTTLQVEFVNYDQVGNRTVLPASGWTLSPNAAGAATVSPAGVLTVIDRTSLPMNLSVTGMVAGQPRVLSQDFFVPAVGATARLSGRLQALVGGAAVVGVQLEFVDDAGNLAGLALSGYDGRFTGHVAPSARRVRLKASTVPPAFFAAIRYLGIDYAVVGTACLMPLPAIEPGGSVTLPASIFLPRQVDGPPPPPSGCE